MIVKIAKSERDVIEKNCALFSIPVSFYTIETNEEMLTAEIGVHDLNTAWHVFGMIGFDKAMKCANENLKTWL